MTDAPRHFYRPSDQGFYIEGVSPDIPADAVEITAAEYRALLQGQTAGGSIVVDAGGPAVAYPPPDRRAEALARIAALEAAVTPRMLQEAATGSTLTGLGDGGALTAAQHIAAVRAQVAALRAGLTAA